MIKYVCRRDKSPETSARGKVSRLRRGVRPSPMYLISMSSTREISVFIDESGSFSSSEKNPSSPFCLLCMVFHDQGKDIVKEIERLGNSFFLMGLERDHCVHAGPLIRREQSYAHMPREDVSQGISKAPRAQVIYLSKPLRAVMSRDSRGQTPVFGHRGEGLGLRVCATT